VSPPLNELVGNRYLRVNHAGEHGAVQIYRGQIAIARWRCPSVVEELRAFKAHEEGHRASFWTALQARGQRRCRSYQLCAIGGYALGILTALGGASAIGATTVAVESVVLRHLEQQLNELRGIDAEAVAVISTVVAEERQHHDGGIALLGERGRWKHILMPLVSASTSAVIWLGLNL